MLSHSPSCPTCQEKGTSTICSRVRAGHGGDFNLNILENSSYSPARIGNVFQLDWLEKQLTGGWKVIQDVCPECDEEDNCSVDSRNSRFSRRSVASKGSQKPEGSNNNKFSSSSKSKSPVGVSGSKSFRRSTSSCAPDRGARNDVEYSTSQSDQMRTKLEKIHVTDDDNREDGIRQRPTREKATTKDKQYREKRSSKISYTDEASSGNASGAKCESKKSDGAPNGEVNDITTPRQRYPKEEKAHCKQRALKEYKDLYESAKVVKNMLFVDVHGDAGRYTGDVNEFRMPHGQGNIIYEHGLVQGGKWVSSLFDCVALLLRLLHFIPYKYFDFQTIRLMACLTRAQCHQVGNHFLKVKRLRQIIESGLDQ